MTYFQGAAASGAHPRLAEAPAESAAPADPDEVFDRSLQRLRTARVPPAPAG